MESLACGAVFLLAAGLSHSSRAEVLQERASEGQRWCVSVRAGAPWRVNQLAQQWGLFEVKQNGWVDIMNSNAGFKCVYPGSQAAFGWRCSGSLAWQSAFRLDKKTLEHAPHPKSAVLPEQAVYERGHPP